MLRSNALSLCALLALLTSMASAAQITVLYDGAAGGTPDDQGWLWSTDMPAAVSQSAGGGFTTLDTTAEGAASAGYGRSFVLGSLPKLDRAAGYTIVFDVRIAAETHQADDRDGDGVYDRAGFSLIAVSHDLSGIEVAFWTDEIWGYEYEDVGGSFDFTHAEGITGDTTADIRRYRLSVEGSTYELYDDGDAPLLSGPLRTYAPKGAPYSVPSTLYLGDDTSKAAVAVELAYVAHVDEPVPEPVCLSLLAVGGIAVARRRLR